MQGSLMEAYLDLRIVRYQNRKTISEVRFIQASLRIWAITLHIVYYYEFSGYIPVVPGVMNNEIKSVSFWAR